MRDVEARSRTLREDGENDGIRKESLLLPCYFSCFLKWFT